VKEFCLSDVHMMILSHVYYVCGCECCERWYW